MERIIKNIQFVAVVEMNLWNWPMKAIFEGISVQRLVRSFGTDRHTDTDLVTLKLGFLMYMV